MPNRFAAAVSRRVWIAMLVGMVAVLAWLTWLVPPHAGVLGNVLHHLNILPFMLAGLIFGRRGAVLTIALAFVLQAPSLVRYWVPDPLESHDQLVELCTFAIAGLIAGTAADRERTQRQHVEATRAELEEVYLKLRENVDQLRRSERLSAAGKLSASLAHEIRNPLASIQGAAGILARGHATGETQAECLAILQSEAKRLNKLLTDFLSFARPRLPRMMPADPAEIVQSVIALAQHAAPASSVKIVAVPADVQHPLRCDPEQIRQVLLNLLMNAVEASDPGGEVEVRTLADAAHFAIEVRDSGRGIADDVIDSIFDPFFTTREHGTGLGLAIAASIVAQHGGTLAAARNPTRGMTFSVVLPANASPGASEATV